jgi:squalene-associated FAD-dependent desaturase
VPVDVVLVGAGFAGLSAAVRLAAGGARVLVLEARSRLGGRATAFTDAASGELVDNGQHVLFAGYHETFEFLRRIGAESHVWTQPVLSVPYVDKAGRPTTLACPPLPAPFHLLAAVLDWDALSWRERLAVLRLAPGLRAARRFFVHRSAEPPARPEETVDHWLARHGQPPRLRELLWDPLAVAALNQPPEEAAALPFVRVLHDLFAGRAGDAAMVLPARPLHLMYAEPARAFLESRGSEVRTGVQARIDISRAGSAVVTCGAEVLSPCAVVVAVPWFALRSVLQPGPSSALAPLVEAAEAMASCPIVTVNLWYDRQVLGTAFVGLPGRTFQWVFDKQFILGGGASHLSLVSSGAGAILRLSNDALTSLAAREVAAALPAAAKARLTRATVVREPRATFSLAPGQPPRPGTATPIANLFLAGDWIETGLPGTIESAVVSGHRAAAAAARFIPRS